MLGEAAPRRLQCDAPTVPSVRADGPLGCRRRRPIADEFREPHHHELVDDRPYYVGLADITSPYQTLAQGQKARRLFQTPFADRIRHEAGIATMAVGAISSSADANTILAAGRADLVALARAHLDDPYWTRHAAYDFGVRLPWPDPYSSINRYNHRPR